MSDSVTIEMQPTKGFAELARSLRVAAAVAGRDATITWPMTPEEARTFATAIDVLAEWPEKTAEFHAKAEAQIAKMKEELRKQVWQLALMVGLAVAIFVMALPS